ncbi:hypothetical protein JZ751_020407 [Albula glossodonta]|uniref:Saposin B-type domain-containing protein n=1 Tax=Albula glossodonta TaxID=121402 RepID=A0A8T2N3C7_9TELE|nr:hypothetical protein JZ751_020407 [Albula glossodonta]
MWSANTALKMRLIVVILCCLVYSALGSHAPHSDHEEDFLLESSALGHTDSEADLREELSLILQTLNGTQEIPGICWVCRKVLGIILSRIRRHDHVNHIKSVLHSACRANSIPAFICNYFINGYFNKLVRDIRRGMHTPRSICRALRLCWWPRAARKQLL